MTPPRHHAPVHRSGLGDRLARTAPYAPGALLLIWTIVRAAG